MNSKKRPFYKKKKVLIPLIILLILIGARLYLPTWVKGYINDVLADIPGYYGQVDDVDLSLYRGAYSINGMYLNKVDAETQIPFLKFPETDISIEWNALFKGAIVAEIIMNSPEAIYVLEDQKTAPNEESADVDDWTNALKDIVPLEINHFEVYDGTIALVGLMAEPNIDLQINELQLSARNLRNVIEKDRVLPSPITATGVSFGGGTVKLDGNMNLFQEIPDMDISFSLEKSEAKALNELTSYFAGLDFESGTFELYSEIAIADGYLKGYLKPMLTNTTMIGEEDGFLETLWEGFTSFFKFILKNKGTDTIATEVPIEGDLNNTQAGVWPTIGGIFKNGWFKAFKGETDESIEYKDAFRDAKESGKLSKEQKENLTSEEKKKLRKELKEEQKKDTTAGFFKRLFGGDDDS
ncbi:DUF748 domain-containing protein [Autumnicola edwardsiae]|uniref:DUF748 domain-containing protein n=1 Tax=Autumnicola edwardsiae TaxID=3075594 RepID=A0ABU3CZ78_9FLAO|nr:DUF748 domain-containing protein [Zunongwangia sp. F297]MDT0651664.1 DUF748 domain-containing protein [Zunongwangia sp. F297]